MKKIFTHLLLLAAFVFPSRAQEAADYTDGVFILNEDWFGHQNSTINFLRTNGEWEYRIFQKENPGKELGCTSQYGEIFDRRMYIISKQARDMGASVTGGRITVCDAKTLQCIKQLETIATDESGNSIADGRAFIGITPEKGYISTSNGIYVFDLKNLEIGNPIPDTGNDGGGLYSAQCGTMLYNGKYVFAIHQKKGLLIIDAEQDRVYRTIAAPTDTENGTEKPRGFGSIVQSKDGSMWLSVAADVSGRGATVDYFMKFNPETFDTTRVELPAGYGLPSSWYAWTADAFCASKQQNKLYWKKQSGWFTNSVICCYDIDKGVCSEFFDTQSIGWYLYCGAGFRLHPETDELYCSLYLDNLKQTYLTLRLSNTGEIKGQYEMIDNYWFPAMPIFPATDNTALDNVRNTAFTVYPNPATDFIHITLHEASTVELFDLSGKCVYRDRLPEGTTRISLSTLPSGIYLLKANHTIEKIIKP